MFPADRYFTQATKNCLPVRPFGLFVNVESQIVTRDPLLDSLPDDFRPVEPEQYQYDGFIEGFLAKGFWARTPVSFSLPKIQPGGFFKVGSTLFVICNVGFVSPWDPLNYGAYHFLSKREVSVRILEGMFGTKSVNVPGGDLETNNYSPLANFFFQSTPENVLHINNEQLQGILLSRLVTHPFVRQVQPTDVQIQGNEDLVLLHARKDGIKIDPLIFRENLLKCIDPTSTSASGMINGIYQLADGAKIENGKIIPGHSDYCGFTRRNAVFIDMSPSRACLARAAIMNSAELTHPDPRPVCHPEGIVHTRNLKTAIMDLGMYTFEDTIAMSESCARGFEAQSKTRITRWTPKVIEEIKIKRGDVVSPFEVIAMTFEDVINEEAPETVDSSIVADEIDRDEETEDKRKKISIVAAELKEEAILTSIEVTTAWYAGVKGFRTTFVFQSFLPMQTGDKITCFSGNKGVCIVLPDEQMPVIDGQVMDICVSLKSVFKRGTLGMHLEGAIGREYASGAAPQTKCYADEYPFTFTWAARKFRSKSTATYMGKELPEKVFWGVVPWMRILKSGIAVRRLSAVGEDRPLTGEGLLPDTAATAGQSLDPSKVVVMVTRGMTGTLKALLGNTPAGMQILVETVAALDGPAKNDSKKRKRKRRKARAANSS